MTRLLIPDNCKTATTANTRYETVLNRSYQELAEYYGTAIVPARVRKPQDKSAAEASVRFAETWIIAALRDRKFFSIGEVNEAIAEKLEELNNRPFQWMAGTRRSAWLEEEKPYMLPLPAASAGRAFPLILLSTGTVGLKLRADGALGPVYALCPILFFIRCAKSRKL